MTNKKDALQLRQKVSTLQGFLSSRREHLERWCGQSAAKLSPDALIGVAISTAVNPESKLAQCTPISVYQSLIKAATIGLEPDGPGQQAHLIPRWNRDLKVFECTYMPGYRGLIALMLAAGVEKVSAHVVYRNDSYKILLGEEPSVLHEIELTDRGEPIGVYAIARMESGIEVEAMSWGDVEKIRAVAADTPAWRQWPEQMARKSVIKRMANRMALGQRVQSAISADNAATVERVQSDGFAPPAPIIDIEDPPPREPERAPAPSEDQMVPSEPEPEKAPPAPETDSENDDSDVSAGDGAADAKLEYLDQLLGNPAMTPAYAAEIKAVEQDIAAVDGRTVRGIRLRKLWRAHRDDLRAAGVWS